MAGLFSSSKDTACHLLDAGAGIGSLSSAFLERNISGDLPFNKTEITAFEFDDTLHDELENTLASYSARAPFSYEIIGGDFIEEAVNRIQFGSDNNLYPHRNIENIYVSASIWSYFLFL